MLPFASVSPVESVAMKVSYENGVKVSAFTCMYRDGRSAQLSLRETEDGTLTGQVRMDLAEEEGKEQQVRAFTFNYAWDAGEETYDLDLDKCEHLSD